MLLLLRLITHTQTQLALDLILEGLIMLKAILITLLIIYIAYRVAGFLLRNTLLKMGADFRRMQNGPQQTTSQNGSQGRNTAPRSTIRDDAGDYVDYKEIK